MHFIGGTVVVSMTVSAGSSALTNGNIEYGLVHIDQSNNANVSFHKSNKNNGEILMVY